MKKSVILLLIFFLLLALPLVLASQLKVTSEHPFLLNGKWIAASELKVGDKLSTIEGKTARITGIEEIKDNVEVYNLHVNNVQTYFANGILVHNKPMPADYVFENNKPLSEVPRVGAVDRDIRLLYRPALDPSSMGQAYIARKISSCDIPKRFYKLQGVLSSNHLGAKGVYYDGKFYLLLPPEIENLGAVKFSTPHHMDMLFKILKEKGILTPDMIPASITVDTTGATVKFWDIVMANINTENPDILKKAFGFEFEYVPASALKKAKVYVKVISHIDDFQLENKIPVSRTELKKAGEMAVKSIIPRDTIEVETMFGAKTRYGRLWNQGV